jgi:hypothetical protein
MKKINLLIACIIFSWSLTIGQIQFFTLSEQKISLSNKSYTILKVTDERIDKTNIGWTQKGMSNRKVNASFSNPLEKEVENFLKANLNSGGPSIQIIIRTLKISEKTGAFSEEGFCELAVDFLLENESTIYRVLLSSQISEIKGADVTKKHPQNIANAFKLCFDQLSKVDLKNIESFIVLSTNGQPIHIPDFLKYDFLIFKEEIKTGIYATYNDLKNNTPSSNEKFIIEKKPRTFEPWIGTYEIIPKFQESSKEVKKVWGIAYEGQVYVYYRKEFFPLTIKDYELYFYGYGMPSNESISTGAFVGGLIGAGIASEIENSKAKKQKVKYFLDPITGGIGETILEENGK